MPSRQLLVSTQKRNRTRNPAKPKKSPKSGQSRLKVNGSKSKINNDNANVERSGASRSDDPYAVNLKNGGKLIIKAEVHSPPRLALVDAGERYEDDNCKALDHVSEVYPNPTVVLHAAALSFLAGDDWPKVFSGSMKESSKVTVAEECSKDREKSNGKCGVAICEKNVLPVVSNEVCFKPNVENKRENQTVTPIQIHQKDNKDDINHSSERLQQEEPLNSDMAVEEDIFGEENSMLNHLPLLKSAMLKSSVSSRKPSKSSSHAVASAGKQPLKRSNTGGKRKMADKSCQPSGNKHIKDCTVDEQPRDIIKDGPTGKKTRSSVRKRPRVSSRKTNVFSTHVSGDEESGIFSSLAEANIPRNDKVLEWMILSAEHMSQNCQDFISENEECQSGANCPSVTQSKQEAERSSKAPVKKRRKLNSSKKSSSRNCNRESEAIIGAGNDSIEGKLVCQNDTKTGNRSMGDSSNIQSAQVYTPNVGKTEIASFKCYVGLGNKSLSRDDSYKRAVSNEDSKSAAHPVATKKKDEIKQLPEIVPVQTLEQSIISSPELFMGYEPNKADPLKTNLNEGKFTGPKNADLSYSNDTEDSVEKDSNAFAPLTTGIKLKIVRKRKINVTDCKKEFSCVKDDSNIKQLVSQQQSYSSDHLQANVSKKQRHGHNHSSAGNQVEYITAATEISPPSTDVVTLKEKTRSEHQMQQEKSDGVARSTMSHFVTSPRPETGCESLARIYTAKSPRTAICQSNASLKVFVSNTKSLKANLLSPHLQADRHEETNNSKKINAISSVASFYGRTKMEALTAEPSPKDSKRVGTHNSQEHVSLTRENGNNESQSSQNLVVPFDKGQNKNNTSCDLYAAPLTKQRKFDFGKSVISKEVQSYSSLASGEIKWTKMTAVSASDQSSLSPHQQRLKFTSSPSLTLSSQEVESQKVCDDEQNVRDQDNSAENFPETLQEGQQIEESGLQQSPSALSNMSNSNVNNTVTTPNETGNLRHGDYEDEQKEASNFQSQQSSLFMIKSNNVAKISLFGDRNNIPTCSVLSTSTTLLRKPLTNTKLWEAHTSIQSNRVISSSTLRSIEPLSKNPSQNIGTEKRGMFTNWRNESNGEIIDTRSKISSSAETPRPDFCKTTLREVTRSFGLVNSNAPPKSISFGDTFSKFGDLNTSLQECSSGTTNLDFEVPGFNSVPSTRECTFKTGDIDFNDTLSIGGMSLVDENGNKPVPSTPLRPSMMTQIQCSYSNNSFSPTYQRQFDIPRPRNSYRTKPECFRTPFGQISDYRPSRPVAPHQPTSNQYSDPFRHRPTQVINRNGIEYQVITAKLLVPQYNPLQYLNQVPPQPLLLTARQQRAPGPQAWVKEVDRSLESFQDYDVHALG